MTLNLLEYQRDLMAHSLKEEIDWTVMNDMLKEVGWIEVTIGAPWSDMTNKFISEIRNWCNLNISGHHRARGRTWLFENEKDAIMFSLRWA